LLSDESINYCPECQKYFDDPDELEVHKNVKHGGKQNTLFEQLVPQYLDQQNIMIEDQSFSLPPPRKHADYNEAKANWEGMWEAERIKVLKDAMLDTEYCEYSFSELPEDVQNKIYFTLQKYATTRNASGFENEQNITDDGVDSTSVDGQFDDHDSVKDNEFDFGVLPLASIGLDVAKSLEPSIRLKAKQYLKQDEAIPLDCPQCKKFRGRPHELYIHLRTQGFDNENAKRITDRQISDWKREQIDKIQKQNSADQIKQKKGLLSGLFESKSDEYIMQWNGLEDLANSLTSEMLDNLSYKELQSLMIQVERNIELIKDSLNEPEHLGIQNDNSKARLILSQLELGVAEIESKFFDAKNREDKREYFSPLEDYMNNPRYTFESMLKSEILSPYEISNRNGEVISQHVETEEEVQEIINRYQSEYVEKHYGSQDAIIVRDSIGNDVSRMFKNAIQEWETTSIENIDKQLEYTERGLGI